MITQSQHDAKIKEFDRQIKEAKAAASWALTLNLKLICIAKVKELESQRLEFRKKFIIQEFEKDSQPIDL